jgi:hypothetical protein
MPDISIGQAIVIVGLVFAWLIYVIARGLSER